MNDKDIKKHIDSLLQQTYDVYLKDREINSDELNKIKDYISNWFLEMYEKDSDVLKEMSKSDDLLKMIQREFRFSKLLD